MFKKSSEMIIVKSVIVILLVSAVKSASILGVFLSPSYSHQIIFQPIWKELSLRGHQVTVITPNPLKDPTLTNLTEIDMSTSYNIVGGFDRGRYLLKDKTAFSELTRLRKLYQISSEHFLTDMKIQKLIEDKNRTFDLILMEYLYPSMYFFKDIYNCPMVGITSLGLSSFGHEMIGNPNNPVLHPNFLLPFSSDLTFSQRILSIIYEVVSKFTYKRLMNEIDELFHLYVKRKVRPAYELCRDFSLVVVNSNMAMYNARPLVPNLIDISGIHIKDPKPLPKELQEYLDESKEGVIYFSLGTNTKASHIPKAQLDAILGALSEVPYNVLWKVDNQTEIQLPPNIRKRTWFPQQDVLAHPNIKLFITQAGIQSLDEAIFKKVPVLMIPLFADQRYNADHMTKRGGGLAVEFDTITKMSFKNSIEEVITNPRYRENMNTLNAIATDHPMPPTDRAVWWIEYVLRHKGAPHLKYTGRDIPFYQFFMLDIIAFFLLILCIVVAISIVLIRRIRNFFIVLNNYSNKHLKLKDN